MKNLNIEKAVKKYEFDFSLCMDCRKNYKTCENFFIRDEYDGTILPGMTRDEYPIVFLCRYFSKK